MQFICLLVLFLVSEVMLNLKSLVAILHLNGSITYASPHKQTTGGLCICVCPMWQSWIISQPMSCHPEIEMYALNVLSLVRAGLYSISSISIPH